MTDYRRIFLVLDPGRRRTPAFDRAIKLARTTGAELHLGLYDHNPSVPSMGIVSREVMDLAHRQFVREREAWLKQVALELIDEGIPTATELDCRTPVHEAIVTRVLELKPDLVIKDVHHEPLLRRVLFTPLDWQLLRLCPATLLLVNRRADTLPRRVIAAVDTLQPDAGDGSLNERIVNESLAFALQCGAEVHLVHAFNGPPVPAGDDIGGSAMLDSAYRDLARFDRSQFEAFAARRSVPPERQHLLQGTPAVTIPEFAHDAAADLVVLGTVYRTGLQRLMIGSTAERILDRLRCDLLAVKPVGFTQDVLRHLGIPVQEPKRHAA